MSNKKVQIKSLIFNTDEILSKKAGGSDVFNEYLFDDWECHEKTLKSKALEMTKQLDFFDMEVLINHDDYVHFENDKAGGHVNNRIIISKKIGDEFTEIGGFQTSHKRTKTVSCGYWRGEYQGEQTDIKQYSSWIKLKTKLRSCMTTRQAVRAIFFYC